MKAQGASLAQAQRQAKRSGLTYVSDHQPGITRIRRGKQFRYLSAGGRIITSPRTLQRIRSLAIPPAYTQVWICPDERGHLQATGRDARGRKQYRYHPQWRAVRDGYKFSRMLEFARQLPRLRRRLKADLAQPGLTREKVLAAVVELLQETLIRVGNEEYARSNRSYGLTTLRDHHVQFLRDGRARLKFRGKAGQPHEIVLDDKRLAAIVRRCQQLPGQQLFQYVDAEGRRQPIDSGMVNEYLREAMSSGHGEGFTAKDFRTWGATLRAIMFLSRRECGEELTERDFKRCVVETAQHVAAALGNTPAVCRKSYINPVVFEAWRGREIARRCGAARLGAMRMEQLAIALLRSSSGTAAALPRGLPSRTAGACGVLAGRKPLRRSTTRVAAAM